MAKRVATRNLSDSYMKARAKKGKPPRVSFIVGGIKYKGGKASRVCPAGFRKPTTMATRI